MLVLDERVRKHIEYIAENGTYTCSDNGNDCKRCILSCFDNEYISCQQIAKELLKLLASKEKENE